MNNIKTVSNISNSVEDFAKNYIKHLYDLLNRIDKDAIAMVVDELETARANNNTIFLVGNGGSAATASHMANDLGGDICRKTGSKIAYRALALTDNSALNMAIANDDGYENIFVNQLRVHYRDGDKLLAISASGNSPNIVLAARWVKERGGKVIGFTGFDGGELIEISDISLHVNSGKGDYGPVEDIHLILNHLISNWLQYKIKE